MATALPLSKLVGLLVKTLAKPVSKRIKHDFSRYGPTKQFLVAIGQTNHQITSRMTIWSAGYRVRSIPPLEAEKALSNGADFFGESLVFLVSGSIIVWEYQRSQSSAKAKADAAAAKVKEDQAKLNAKLHALDVRLQAVEVVVKRNSDSILHALGPAKYVPPDDDELVSIVDEEVDIQAMKEVVIQKKQSSNKVSDRDESKPSSSLNQVDASPPATNEKTRSSWIRRIWPF